MSIIDRTNDSMSRMIGFEELSGYSIDNEYITDHFKGFKIQTCDDSKEDASAKLSTLFPRIQEKFKNIYILISETTCCCEVWNIEVVEGLEILEIPYDIEFMKQEIEDYDTYVATADNVPQDVIIERIEFGSLPESSKLKDDENAKVCVIDIHTNQGVVKFVLSNISDSGYYPHIVYFTFNDYIHTEIL
jgi:hypothetical protein